MQRGFFLVKWEGLWGRGWQLRWVGNVAMREIFHGQEFWDVGGCERCPRKGEEV